MSSGLFREAEAGTSLQEASRCQDDAEHNLHTVKTALVYLAFSLSWCGNAKSSEKLKS